MKKFLLIIFVFGFAYFAILVSDEMGRQGKKKMQCCAIILKT